MTRATLTLAGQVQGVGFRYAVARLAREQKLTGYVKNLEDGRVEVVVEGEQQAIQQLEKAIRDLPPPIKVEDVETKYEKETGEFKTFKIITGKLEEEMVEGFATGSIYLQLILAKQDEMLQKQDKMLQKQDEMLRKQDDTLGELRGLRTDLKAMLEERLSRIERDVAAIKSRLGMA